MTKSSNLDSKITEVSESLCWNCKGEVSGVHFCESCVKIQPPPNVDYFQFVGLEQKLKVDLKYLEKRFYELSRRFHPDFYQNRSDNERSLSLENSARLNEAYRTLKDPFLRAEYIINLEEGAVKNLEHKPPMDLFEEIFELQEMLGAIRELKGKSDIEKRKQLEENLKAAKEELAAKRTAMEAQLKETFDTWDDLVERVKELGVEYVKEGKQSVIRKMKEILSNRNYLSTIIRDIDKELS